ncbi:MAG: site-specific integrase [Coriobacteriales bacterium]|jgi:integrase|nr:site-specific integrase [Coriobacteriales bacterium]
MSIQEYADKAGRTRWRAHLEVGRRLDGTPDRRSKVCDTLKEAQRAERGLYIVRDGLAGRSDRDTFGAYVAEHYLPAKRRELRGLTVRGYESVIDNHLLPTLGGHRMGEINRAVVQSLITGRSSNKVARNARDVLRQILGHACDNGVIRSNPAAGRFNFPARAATDRDNSGAVVTDLSEHRRIIRLARDGGEPVLPVLVLGLCLGMRKEEVLGTDCSHVDLGARRLDVRQSYLHVGGQDRLERLKNEHSYRTLPVPALALEHLAPLCRDRVGPVCVHRGQRMTQHQAQKLMRGFVERHGLPRLTCQSLRHSFATAALKAGVPVELVSRMLGHSSITTTYNRYVRPTKDDVMQVAEMLDKASGI